ncbi:hypothetical protein ACWPMX_07795 [Tsuneonella sp. HG094]
MEEALVARLVAANTSAEDRISWFGRARGDGLPAVALTLVSPGEEWTHDGPDGLDRPRVRMDIYAATDLGALALGRELRAVMHGEATVAGVRFHPARLEASRTLDGEEQDGGDPLFRLQHEYLFYHEET